MVAYANHTVAVPELTSVEKVGMLVGTKGNVFIVVSVGEKRSNDDVSR
jgi:hypothetical protein